jgi:hypothetical protein
MSKAKTARHPALVRAREAIVMPAARQYWLLD